MASKIIPDVVENQTLHTLPPTASALDAAQEMAAKRISAVLVTEGERLLGIFTERDLATRVVAAGRDPGVTRLHDVMTPKPDTLSPDDSPMNALELMRIRHYRHLPVADRGKVVGMVSIRDLYAVVQAQLEHDVREREAFIFDTGYGAGA